MNTELVRCDICEEEFDIESEGYDIDDQFFCSHCEPDHTYWCPVCEGNRHGEKMNYQMNKEVKDNLWEIMAPNCHGYSIFDGGLRHNKVTGIQHRIVLYDLLAWRGDLLLNWDYEKRRDILGSFPGLSERFPGCEENRVTLTNRLPNKFREVFVEFTKNPEIEGLVMKNRKGIINLGRRAPIDSSWMWKVRRKSGICQF